MTEVTRGLITRCLLAGAAMTLPVLGLSACGASAALGNAFLAPLSVLPDTDVVLETNLQLAQEGGVTGGLGGISGINGISGVSGVGGSGVDTVTGAPTTPSEVSLASVPNLVTVYTAFNPVDQHCLGVLVLQPGATITVLGVSTPGRYDFWFGKTTATKCAASNFDAESTHPSHWASGDPSASGWPNS
jgi:hypothetical protein